MLLYILGFVAIALFPLALAGYGGHLATEGIENPKKKRNALLLVWGLALAGVICGGLQQIYIYHSDQSHDQKAEQLQTRIEDLQKTANANLEKANAGQQTQAYMRGQLDSIGLMMGKYGEKSSDPAISQLASAVVKIANNSARTFSNAQLKDAALDLARRIREFDVRRCEPLGNMPAIERLRQTPVVLAEFAPLRAEAQNMQVQLLNRLPPQPEDSTVDLVLKG